MKELSEKLKRMLPYFDLDPEGAFVEYAYRHPLKYHPKWTCLIPILFAAFILSKIFNHFEWNEVFPVHPYICMLSVATILICYSSCRKEFPPKNMLGKGVWYGLTMMIYSGISFFITMTFTQILWLIFHLDKDICSLIETVLLFAITLVFTFLIYYGWCKSLNTDKQQLKELENDSCFLEFYKSEANRNSGWKTAGNSFRSWYNISLIDTYEIGKQLQTPVLTHPSYTNSGSDYIWQIYTSFLNRDLFQSKLKETGNESLFHYFIIKDDAFKIRNDEKERYILLIQDIIKSMPLPFNIGEIHQLLSRDGAVYYMQDTDRVIHTPNLSAIVASLMEQPPLQKLTGLYDTYARNFSQFSSEAKGTIIGESGERAVMEEFAFYANKWRILQNIRLEVNGQSVESDIIAVTPYGVFVVEVKNLGSTGSYNITVEKDGLWKKVMKNGRWKAMGSVSRQNTRHLHGIEEVVNEALQNDYAHWIQANSIIVFANDVVGIRNYSPNVIVRASEMVGEIRKHPICLDESQIEAIATILEQRTLEPKKYEMPNYGKDILAVYLDVYYRANALLPQIKPVLDIIETLAKIPDPPLPIDFSVIDNNTAFSLEDNEADYEAPAESKNNDSNTPPSYYGGSDDDDGSSGGNYDSEYDSAVGNCEMGNSYSYSWYDPSYDSYAQDLRDNMGIK